jgi:hypothetical protein
MAWDKFKQDIIGEPIQVLGAEELAKRLNGAPFPTSSIEERSYYAIAGFVKNGIIEQIQKEMRRRFPSEPVPTAKLGAVKGISVREGARRLGVARSTLQRWRALARQNPSVHA